jgi:hypothetical protein
VMAAGPGDRWPCCGGTGDLRRGGRESPRLPGRRRSWPFNVRCTSPEGVGNAYVNRLANALLAAGLGKGDKLTTVGRLAPCAVRTRSWTPYGHWACRSEPASTPRRARVGSSCISFAGPGATAPRRCCSSRSSCWSGWPPSSRRRADLCWPTMGSSARGRAGDRPSFRSHRRPTHGETSTHAPRGAGPGLGYSSGCSALMCWGAIAAGAGGGSSAR